MNAFYVLWDALDDLLFRKENESDAALFARMTTPHIHGKYDHFFFRNQVKCNSR